MSLPPACIARSRSSSPRGEQPHAAEAPIDKALRATLGFEKKHNAHGWRASYLRLAIDAGYAFDAVEPRFIISTPTIRCALTTVANGSKYAPRSCCCGIEVSVPHRTAHCRLTCGRVAPGARRDDTPYIASHIMTLPERNRFRAV